MAAPARERSGCHRRGTGRRPVDGREYPGRIRRQAGQRSTLASSPALTLGSQGCPALSVRCDTACSDLGSPVATDLTELSAPLEVHKLVARFRENSDAYRSLAYKEAQVRVEFIDPLFRALGWDMSNEQGAAEAYKDVVYEAALKFGGGTKAPDYAFRIGGRRKFFVEAKKPSVNLEEGASPAFQLRRYAWTAQLAVSVLTDFEEFAVYDCRYAPDAADGAATARLIYLTLDDYETQWHELHALFGREAVLNGSLEEFASRAKRKRGTAPVDEVFLNEIERWREVLAVDLYHRNAGISQRELNYAVQMTIDRIVFLRMSEDRGIETYGRLRDLREQSDLYSHLGTLFREADAKYNSGLFHFEAEAGRTEDRDSFTLQLEIGDDAIREILSRLYFPESPYEFSVFPPEILGQVYERFLGRAISLSDGAVGIVEKPELRKAGGVYYTPTRVVEYMVAQALGPLTGGRSPTQVRRLKVLDPACGSGSFLLGVYQYLLDWYRDWYVADGPEKHRRRLYEAPGGEWRLTIGERKRILLDNIFGVDIDAQAVETTKLSLLLKVLEAESAETVGETLRLFHERALPDLGANIKSGNSLVGVDYYEQARLDQEQRYRINPFDWTSGFSSVFDRTEGGFDVVIGNPPYVFGEYLDADTKTYLQDRYRLASNQFDTYALFIEAGVGLVGRRGMFSMIVPDAVLARDLAADCRDVLLNAGLQRVFHCGQVFDAGVSAAILVARKGTRENVVSDVWSGLDVAEEHICSRRRFEDDPEHRLLVHTSDEEAAVLERLAASGGRLADAIAISRGEELGKKDVLPDGPVPILVGDDIAPYAIKDPSRFIRRPAKSSRLYEAPKIVIVKTGARCIGAIERQGFVTMQSVYNLRPKRDEPSLEAILAVLNSRVVEFVIFKKTTAYKLLFPQLNQTTLEELPLPAGLSGLDDELSQAVSAVEDAVEALTEARVPQERVALLHVLAVARRRVDELVYAAFGLDAAEVAVIEGAVRA